MKVYVQDSQSVLDDLRLTNDLNRHIGGDLLFEVNLMEVNVVFLAGNRIVGQSFDESRPFLLFTFNLEPDKASFTRFFVYPGKFDFRDLNSLTFDSVSKDIGGDYSLATKFLDFTAGKNPFFRF
ncbi:MAG: hypothetical protein ACD_61C00006G0001 [uncultured bacterium]|nr:MAG: hypothetical protein ACD_61C00006G0001 [uncultured bacterium]